MSKLNRILCCIFSMVILACTATGVITVSAASKNTVTTSISKVESKAKGFKVTWKKKSKINGYQIQYSTSSKFKKSETKTKTVSKAKTASATVSKLKGCNKKYYVRVRTYKVVKDKKVYSSWSKAKSVTTLKHKYSAATCTKAKVCKYCDKTSGEKLGHKWSKATCTKAKTCTRCEKTSGDKLGHKWSKATCTEPKTCTRCDKTSGEKLGHKWSKATCTEPKTCTRCDKASGENLGHKWEEATCTGAKTCSRCDKTSGKPLGHDWVEGSCTEPETCSRCDVDSGVVSGHNWYKYVCEDCGEIDKTHAYEYLIEWVKANGEVDGSSISFDYWTEDKTRFALTYSATDDFLYVSESYYYKDTFFFHELDLDDYKCYTSFGNLEVLTSINAKDFTNNSPVREIWYIGSSEAKWDMLEINRTSTLDLLSWLEWCFDYNEVGIDVYDLGFESYE